MRRVKSFCAVLFLMLLLAFVPAEAAHLPEHTAAEETEGRRYEERIVYKYRVWNGKLQYRRWNETRGYWVDPQWLDAE